MRARSRRTRCKESFATWSNVKLILVALFGIAAGLTVIWYTAQFQAIYFLQNALRIEDTAARVMIGVARGFLLLWFILFGWLSDRVGRKKPIVIGYALTILLMFPLVPLDGLGRQSRAFRGDAQRNPVVVAGQRLQLRPFAKGQTTECGKLLDALSKKGIAYSTVAAPAGRARRR